MRLITQCLMGGGNVPVTDLAGPIRGYSRYWQSLLDHWSTTIKVFPATGVTATGEVVRGYYPEVSGDGTLLLRGPSSDEKIFQSALNRMAAVAKRYNVVSLKRSTYNRERDTWRLNEGSSLRDGGTINVKQVDGNTTAEERLQKIYNLFEKGVITKSEYEQLKASVLKDI